MCEFTIALAGRNVQISCLHEKIKRYCREYLTDGEPELRIVTTQQDIDYERERSAREDEVEGIPVRSFGDDYLESLAVYRKIAVAMLDFDTLLFHGSAISVDGEAYLFTAKSGTGKSTHTALWRAHFGDRAVTVNDDKPLLRVTDSQVLVCGTPWNGKHRLGTNICVPLKGICILSRAEKNHIERVSVAKALPMLLQQSYRPEDPVAMVKTMGLLNKLVERTGLFALGCNMDPEAATVAYEGMKYSQEDAG